VPATQTERVVDPSTPPSRSSLEVVVRALAAASAAGALLGVLVGGVGGRLAMALLARLNPEDAGRITDDGFSVGRFTLTGSLNLLGASVQAGLTGALLYLALRKLALGPPAVRVASLTLGGTVVLGTFLVHPAGRDFRILEPDWLPVLLFLAIPAVFIPLLAVLAERWLAPASWFGTAPLRRVAPVLLVWLVAGVLLPLLGVAVVVGLVHHRLSTRLDPRVSTALAWTGRVVLGALGVWALVVLVEAVGAVT
jgi:hypothetical protein